MKKTLKWLRNITGPAALLLILGVCAASFGTVSAAPNCQSPYTFNPDTGRCENTSTPAPGGGTTTDGGSTTTTNTPKVTRYDPSPAERDPALGSGNCASASKCDIINNYVNPGIRFLTAFVGLAVTIAIVYGGIEYGSSGGDPAKAAAGKNRIRNAVFTLIAFFFLYALLNFLIPGGVNS